MQEFYIVDIEEMGQADSTVKKLSIIFALMGDKELPPKGSTRWWGLRSRD